MSLTPPGVAWNYVTSSPVMTSCGSGAGCAYVNYRLSGTTWTGSQFVAVGGPGAVVSPAWVFTSPDGATWTSRTVTATGSYLGASYTLLAVAWSGTTLVAAGDHYYVYVSP